MPDARQAKSGKRRTSSPMGRTNASKSPGTSPRPRPTPDTTDKLAALGALVPEWATEACRVTTVPCPGGTPGTGHRRHSRCDRPAADRPPWHHGQRARRAGRTPAESAMSAGITTSPALTVHRTAARAVTSRIDGVRFRGGIRKQPGHQGSAVLSHQIIGPVRALRPVRLPIDPGDTHRQPVRWATKFEVAAWAPQTGRPGACPPPRTEAKVAGWRRLALLFLAVPPGPGTGNALVVTLLAQLGVAAVTAAEPAAA